MAKWHGKIGYATIAEDPVGSGIWVESTVEREYYGDLVRNRRNLVSSDTLNDNITVSNEISVISDPYGLQNFHAIRYAEFMGTKWKVNNVEVSYPRLLLSIGGVFNEQSSGSSSNS